MRDEIIRAATEQLAIDNCCNARDFISCTNIFVQRGENDSRRRVSAAPPFFRMTAAGNNAVVCADGRMRPFFDDFMAPKPAFCLFEFDSLRKINDVLVGFGERLVTVHYMLLPLSKSSVADPTFDVKWFKQNEIMHFYGDGRFPNALGPKYSPERPDVLAVAAIINGEIAGMAGCSADCEQMWQIGVDVGMAYRGRGIGASLVSLLRAATEQRGRIPFYGISAANIYSLKIALKCGFEPFWTEAASAEI